MYFGPKTVPISSQESSHPVSTWKPASLRAGAIFYAALLCILIIASYYRLYEIKRIGMWGVDTFQYWSISKSWSQGKPEILFYRPVAYIIQVLALKTVGYNDYSIKVINWLISLGNMLLIVAAANMLLSNKWVGLGCAFVYAFLPTAIEHSRHELLHIYGETFVLLSAITLIVAVRKNDGNKLLVFLSGLSISFASQTHNDLAVAIIAPFVVLLATCSPKKYGFQNAVKKYFLLCITISAGFWMPYIVGGIFFGFRTLYNNMAYIKSINPLPSLDLVQLPYFILKITGLSVRLNTNRIFEVFFWTSLIYSPFLSIWLARKNIDWKGHFVPVLMGVSYIVGYVIIVQHNYENGGEERLFFPFVSLLILHVNYWHFRLLEIVSPRWVATSVVLLTSAAFVLTLPPPFSRTLTVPSVYRQVYEIAGDKVNQENRLLVLPLNYSVGLAPYRIAGEMYFGNNAIYLASVTKEGSLEDIVRKFNIRFIYIAGPDSLDPNAGWIGGRHGPIDPGYLKKIYGIEAMAYSSAAEIRAAMDYLGSVGAEIIHRSDSIGIIAKLPRAPQASPQQDRQTQGQ
jgi:hypothetical protein